MSKNLGITYKKLDQETGNWKDIDCKELQVGGYL